MKKGMVKRWYVSNRTGNDDYIMRGPFRYAETAGAVRREMEDRWPEKNWNLGVTYQWIPKEQANA